MGIKVSEVKQAQMVRIIKNVNGWQVVPADYNLGAYSPDEAFVFNSFRDLCDHLAKVFGVELEINFSAWREPFKLSTKVVVDKVEKQ